MTQGESELVAKDDNLDAADPNKDKKNQDKDEQMDTEEKDKINEQGDEVITLLHTSSCLCGCLDFSQCRGQTLIDLLHRQKDASEFYSI